jgi:hypothetical protein
LFDVQLTRNPGSVWGVKRASIKQAYREKHPVPVEEVIGESVPKEALEVVIGSMLSAEEEGQKHQILLTKGGAEDGKKGKKVKRYTDGHIQNMARWKVLNKFCRFLFSELKKLEKELSEAEDSSEDEKVA